LIYLEKALPAIPAKRYFTIGEVAELCQVKPYVLRYWEQEFTQLKPMKRRGNRRYYQHHEVLLIRRIRDLLYEQGFTISGARLQLGDTAVGERRNGNDSAHDEMLNNGGDHGADEHAPAMLLPEVTELSPSRIRAELLALRELLQE
jgi:DNA-binding transcriptional MerR regulator